MPDQHWPWPERMAVQRHEQDDPHRPFKYVVLDGTQSTDFSNTESYGLVRAARKQRDEELRERLEKASLKDKMFEEAVKHLSFESPEHQEEYVWGLVDAVAKTVADSIFEEADGGEHGLDRDAGGVSEQLEDVLSEQANALAVDEWPFDDDPPDPL